MSTNHLATQVFEEIGRPKYKEWNAIAAKRVEAFAAAFKENIFEDDTFCDFGGGDGQAAAAWRKATRCRSIVLDCTQDRLQEAEVRGLETRLGVMEKLPFDDCSVQWGFCSHTLEHVESLDTALAELRRVITCAVMFVVPLETDAQAAKTAAHVRHSPDENWWLDQIRAADFIVTNHIVASTPGSDARELIAVAMPPAYHAMWKQGANTAEALEGVKKLDVVIAWYKQAHLWNRVLEGLLENSACINRVFVVNDESWLKDPDPLLNTGGLDITFLSHAQSGRGPSQSFNEGVAAATTEHVLLMEGDIVLPKGALLQDGPTLQPNGLLLRGVVRVDPDTYDVLQPNVREDHAPAWMQTGRAWNLMQCNYLIVDRAAFTALGGFDEELCALHAGGGYSEEDTDLGVRWCAAYGADSVRYRMGVAPVIHLGGRKNKPGDDNAFTPMEARAKIAQSMGKLYNQQWHLFHRDADAPLLDHVNVAHLERAEGMDVRLDCFDLSWLPYSSANLITVKLPLEYFKADAVTPYIDHLLLRLARGGVLDVSMPNYPLVPASVITDYWRAIENWQLYPDITMVHSTDYPSPRFIFTRAAA